MYINMHMADYFAWIKCITNILALAGKLVEISDFVMHVLIGLDSSDN